MSQGQLFQSSCATNAVAEYRIAYISEIITNYFNRKSLACKEQYIILSLKMHKSDIFPQAQ